MPLREKSLWRMLYETAARASEVLSLDVADRPALASSHRALLARPLPTPMGEKRAVR